MTGRIDHLNFENGEIICSTQIIRAARSTVASLYHTLTFDPYPVLTRLLFDNDRTSQKSSSFLKIKFFKSNILNILIKLDSYPILL
jgi:hypothetical protein